MKNRLLLPLFFLLSLLRVVHAFAGVEQLSEAEFRDLAKEIAPKVNLFRDVWAADPKAEFYGGTSRDYFYWLKGKFKEAKTKEEAQKIAQGLRQRRNFDVREFIIGGSDIDIISGAQMSVDPARYGVRKIDTHGANYFDPSSDTWQNEINQGFIPAEKIRLGANGTIPVKELGDGVKEIYNGKLSVVFSDPTFFAQTKYAKEKLNHPILLALRYLRLQAMNYFQEYGAGLPQKSLLFSGMDEASRAAVKKVISDSITRRDLGPYLKQDRFKSWINGTIQKSFLSYTNQTAALEILREFGVDDLHGIYPEVEPINQYVFQQYRDEKAIAASLKKYGVDVKKFYQPSTAFFPDGNLYHGTKTEEAFRSIIFQGALNSTGGSAGRGLYGVSQKHQEFSEEWGGHKDRLLRFPVKPDARIVDIKSGEGARIMRKFGDDTEAFAREFGVDIIRYPYGETDAYVVKNGAALGHAQGVHRELLHFDQLVERLASSKSAEERIGLLKLNSLSFEDMELIHQKFPKLSGEVLDWLVSRKDPSAEAAMDHAAMLVLAKKEIYRLGQSTDPATLEKLARVARPLSVDVVKILLDAPDPLFKKISEELSLDIKNSDHRIYQEGFEKLFHDPQSVKLAPILDKYLQYADHPRRFKFTEMFALPHMAQLEKQMLTMLKIAEPNIHDQFAKHIFTTPQALNYPKGFEAWLQASKVSGNHRYYVEQLLEAPFLKDSPEYIQLVVRHLSARYPDHVAKFLAQLPRDQLDKILPVAMQQLREGDKSEFLGWIFKDRPATTKAEKKVIWDAWLATSPERQFRFTKLVIPQILELPVQERKDYFKRLLVNRDGMEEVASYVLELPPEKRSRDLWALIKPELDDPKLLFRLGYAANFTPNSPERDILEAIAKNTGSQTPPSFRYENLRNLELPRDQKLLLQLMSYETGSAIHREISKALENPAAASSEEVALKILEGSRNGKELGLEKVLVMDHAKDWTTAQLLYLEKAHDWKPNPAQLAAINTPEGKERIRAAIAEGKYGWQKKMYLNRHFPQNGKAVGGLKGFMMDCAAGFAKLK